MEPVTARHTAEERRESVLVAASAAFAHSGLHGASTEDIASSAGISQPYLFRLFGTKKRLFLDSVERCFESTLEVFRSASEGLQGEEAFRAMGKAYVEMVRGDRNRLMGQLQAYAAAEDPEVREVIRSGYRHLFEFVEARSGASAERVSQWFATGMLLNVIAALDLWDSAEPWARRMLEGTIHDREALDQLRQQ